MHADKHRDSVGRNTTTVSVFIAYTSSICVESQAILAKFFRGPTVVYLAQPRAVGKGATFPSGSVPLRRLEPYGATFPPSEDPLSADTPFQLNLAPQRRVALGAEGPHDGLIAGHINPMYVFPSVSRLTRVQFVDRLASISYSACEPSHLPGAQQ